MNTSFLREVNTRAVMLCVKKYGPLSRSEICERTNLSKPTVTRVINGLINDELLMETDVTETVRGRHPINIDIKSDAAYCFGVNISKNHLRVALVDLKLNIVDKTRTSIKELTNASDLLDLIVNTVLEMQKSNQIPDQKVLGIGVGAPGLVDNDSGIVKDFALWGKLRDIHIVSYLEEHTSFKTKVDNNCNTWLAGEMWNGYAQEYGNALFVINSEGVGCGMANNGVINKDINNISAGLGHISVNFKGERCNCGSRGCIETYCTTDNIERKADEKINSIYRINPDIPYHAPIDFKSVCNSIECGDMMFADILLEAASALACGLVSLINIFYPQIIILSGTLFEASDFYYNNVVMEIEGRLSAGVKLPKIVRRNVSDTLFEIGAAAMILQELF